MRFTIDDKHIIKWMRVTKKYEKKPLLKMFLTENEVLMDTDQNISASFVDLCSGVGIVWSTTTRTQVSDADATAITFSH